MKHKERARKKRLQKQERDSLVKQLTPYEMKTYQKNRWKIFRTSYFESLGCGCLLAPMISFLVVFLGIPQRILSEENRLPAFIIFILFFLIVVPILSTWDSRFENEINFLRKLLHNRDSDRQVLLYKLRSALKKLAQTKDEGPGEPDSQDSVFISRT